MYAWRWTTRIWAASARGEAGARLAQQGALRRGGANHEGGSSALDAFVAGGGVYQRGDHAVGSQGARAGRHVVSDGLGCFQAANSEARTHERIVVGGGPQSVQHAEFRWVNTMLGNLKTAFAGTYHTFDYAKYAHRYLAEFAY